MNEKIKVLMIGPARSVNGGISGVVNNYYNAGLDKQIDLTYIGTMEDGSKVHKLLVAAKALLKYVTVVSKCDIVHVNMASDVSIYRKMIFIQIASLCKKIVIIHQHGGHIEEFYYEKCNDSQRKNIQKVLNKAHKMLVIAPYLKDIFANIIEEEKIKVFPDAIKIPPICEKDYSAQKILFLGRLCKEKGVGELIDAVAELRKSYPELQLYLGGSWVDEDLKEKADSHGAWIHKLGWIDKEKKEKYLKECNIFVLPSYFEGQSVALLEGMVYGCACVASDVGGIPQMLIHEKTGLLVPVKDTKGIKDAIGKLLSNVNLQRAYGEAARQKIEKEFNLDTNVKELVQIYQNINK